MLTPALVASVGGCTPRDLAACGHLEALASGRRPRVHNPGIFPERDALMRRLREEDEAMVAVIATVIREVYGLH